MFVKRLIITNSVHMLKLLLAVVIGIIVLLVIDIEYFHMIHLTLVMLNRVEDQGLDQGLNPDRPSHYHKPDDTHAHDHVICKIEL